MSEVPETPHIPNQLGVSAKLQCATCGHPAGRHPFRHPFQTGCGPSERKGDEQSDTQSLTPAGKRYVWELELQPGSVAYLASDLEGVRPMTVMRVEHGAAGLCWVDDDGQPQELQAVPLAALRTEAKRVSIGFEREAE